MKKDIFSNNYYHDLADSLHGIISSAFQADLNSFYSWSEAQQNITTTVNSKVGITELNVSDGTDGQILKTNGSGTLSFTDSGATLQQATAKAVTMAIALG